MKKFALTAAGVFVAGLASAPFAVAAPAGPSTDADTIKTLQASGYKVILNRVGNAPLANCSVVSVRPGRAITETVPAGGGDTVDKVIYTTVFVDIDC